MHQLVCEKCRRNISYAVRKERISGLLKGSSYAYLGEKAACSECGSEVYVAYIEDKNLELLYNEYRKKHKIISLDEIREIPIKYNIGKRPLSLLLGWGEMTFSRFSDGDMPTKQYSDILHYIYENPGYYLSVLEKNKDNLKSQLAYKKSKQKVLQMLEELNLQS